MSGSDAHHRSSPTADARRVRPASSATPAANEALTPSGADARTNASPDAPVDAVLGAFVAIDAAAADVAARMPWLDETAALDLALGATLDWMARDLTPAELGELVRALRAIARRLARSDAASSGRSERFHPSLRRRT